MSNEKKIYHGVPSSPSSKRIRSRKRSSFPRKSVYCTVVHFQIYIYQNRMNLNIILPDYKRADWNGLRTALYRTPLLEAIQGTENMNIAWEVWQQLFSTAVHRYIPTRHIRIRIRNRNKVWMTATLHHLSRQKHRLFRAAKKDQAHWQIGQSLSRKETNAMQPFRKPR